MVHCVCCLKYIVLCIVQLAVLSTMVVVNIVVSAAILTVARVMPDLYCP